MTDAAPDRIGLCMWSARHLIAPRLAEDPLDYFELLRRTRDTYGLGTVELYNGYLESHRTDYLRELRDSAAELGICLWGMAVDVPHNNMCAREEAERRVAVAQNMVYVPVAAELGLEYFRVNTGGTYPPEEREFEQALKSYTELTEVAWDRGVKVVIENHGGLSHDVPAVRRLIEEVGTDRMGTLPDIGNFRDDPQAYDKVGELAAHAVGVHTKILGYDEEGNATNVDVGRMVEKVRAVGVEGPWLLEIGGDLARETDEAILKGKALMERLCWGERR